MKTILKLIFLALLFSTANFSFPARWNTLYSFQTSPGKDVTTLMYNVNSNTPVFRVTFECNDSSVDNLLLVALRQRNSIIGLHVPRIIDNYEFDRVSRTLCPLDHIVGTEPFTIEVSSYKPLEYHVRADLVTDFEIKTNETRLVSASASQPVFYHYRFPEHIDTVLVKMESNSTTCMTVSIQEAGCLVFDLQSNVRYEGLYATMTTHGSIRVAKSSFKEFFVVLVINQNDDLCEDWYNIKHMKPIPLPVLEKTFNLTIVEKIATGWLKNVLFFSGSNIILLFFGILLVLCFSFGCREHPKGYQPLGAQPAEVKPIPHFWKFFDDDDLTIGNQLERFNRPADENAQPNTGPADENAQPNNRPATENVQPNTGPADENAQPNNRPATENVQPNTGPADENALPNNCPENQNIQPNMRPADEDVQSNNNKPPVRLGIHDVYAYIDGILFLSVYYCLFAVIQMLIRETRSNKDSGSFDNCVYNFNCAHSWWFMVSANSVFSNSTYIVLGSLLYISNFYDARSELGIYQHSGVKRAMGVAIISEGFFSATYHLCPSRYNFQFDTINMYLIALLCIKQLWSNRHIVLFPISYSLFYSLLISTIAVIQMYAENDFVFILFGVVHFSFLFFLLLFFYSQGRDIRNIFPCWARRRDGAPVPFSGVRISFSLITLIINIAAFLKMNRNDLFTMELYTLIGTSALYLFYYIIMKFVYEGWRSGIRWDLLPLLISAVVCWIFAAIYFFSSVSDWKVTPAHSRELNKKCIPWLMNLFDAHDLWHTLSAVALFLTAQVLTIIDKNLDDTPRENIKIF